LTDTISATQLGLAETHPIQLAQGFVAALTGASSATDFCRLAVHAEFTDTATIGCELIWVDHQAELKPVARYGVTHQAEDTSLWGESLVAQALRGQRVVISKLEPEGVATGAKVVTVIPFITGGAPVGAMVLTLSDWPQGTELLETQEGTQLTELMSRLGGYYLQTNGITSGRGLIETPPSNGSDGPVLTERQSIVLGFMADGLTNAQIAQQLMLSESSIRQETVRIYRALGVSSRVEAAKKGQALGLIARG
jgi:DNA-binding CsgD family transcriptional regulator